MKHIPLTCGKEFMRKYSPEGLLELVGQELGVSTWYLLTQDAVNAFADVTGDHQWIHVDEKRAAEGPFGQTIAHGFFVLSILPILLDETYRVGNTQMEINYGLNRVRFPSPAKVGSKIQATAVLLEAFTGEGFVQSVVKTTIASSESEKPVCVAESVTRYYL